LIFHGYLLRGTGSNVYNASVARALAGLGHEVHLLCQDRRAAELGWVDAVGAWEGGSLEVRTLREATPGAGSVTVYLPDVGGLLPVYVQDSYEGFEVREFRMLADEEIERYVESNVAAVRDVLARSEIEAALANHLVMGPAILARAGLGRADGGPGFAIKIHGSALSYTVRPEPERFLPYAREGLEKAGGVLVGSRHTAESLWETVGDPGLPARTRLGPPGVDTEQFAPVPEERRRAVLSDLAARIEAQGGGAVEEGSFARDAEEAAEGVRWFAEAAGPRVVFVGKLIVSKGADLLLAAWPLVHARHPRARLLIVGFGAYRDTLELLWATLAGGREADAAEIARAGRGLEGGAEAPLSYLQAFLAAPPEGYFDAAAAAAEADSVRFAGRLDHDEVAPLVSSSEAMVVPSTFPEAFGMVAAEAAAGGALPISADHSGLHEVAAALAGAAEGWARDLLAFPLGEDAVGAIADRLVGWLSAEGGARATVSAQISYRSGELWSWERVATGITEAAAGELDRLPAVPTS
jgi:glycosyltransferase involved in cell wall biosynthesis